MTAAILALVARHAARRPASWIAAGMAALAGGGLALAAAVPATIAAAVVCGGWATIAAAGDVPRGSLPGRVAVDAAIWWVRAAWPLAGAALGCGVAAAAVGAAAEVSGAVALGILVATICGAAATRGGVPAADAASLAACAALATAAVASAAPAARPAVAWAATAAAGLAVVAAGGRRFARVPWPAADGASRPARPLLAELAIACGGPRKALVATAMAASLAGLAGWYFLAPTTAAYGCPFTLGWFFALALPMAVLGAPSGPAWRTLAASAAVQGGRRAGGRRPTGAGWTVAVAVGHAVLLGWPPLVAAVVLAAEDGGQPAGAAGWAWLTVAALALAAACLAGAVFLLAALDVPQESAFAVTIALGMAVAIGCAAGLPSPPALPGRAAVEKNARLER